MPIKLESTAIYIGPRERISVCPYSCKANPSWPCKANPSCPGLIDGLCHFHGKNRVSDDMAKFFVDGKEARAILLSRVCSE